MGADNIQLQMHTIASSVMTMVLSDDVVRLHREFFSDQCHSFCLRQQLNLPLHVYQTARARIAQPVAAQFFLLMQDIDNQMLYRVVCREQSAELCCAREKKKVLRRVCNKFMTKKNIIFFDCRQKFKPHRLKRALKVIP